MSNNIRRYYSHIGSIKGPACTLNIENWNGSFDILIEKYEQYLRFLGKELDYNELSHFVLWLACCYCQRKDREK